MGNASGVFQKSTASRRVKFATDEKSLEKELSNNQYFLEALNLVRTKCSNDEVIDIGWIKTIFIIHHIGGECGIGVASNLSTLINLPVLDIKETESVNTENKSTNPGSFDIVSALQDNIFSRGCILCNSTSISTDLQAATETVGYKFYLLLILPDVLELSQQPLYRQYPNLSFAVPVEENADAKVIESSLRNAMSDIMAKTTREKYMRILRQRGKYGAKKSSMSSTLATDMGPSSPRTYTSHRNEVDL